MHVATGGIGPSLGVDLSPRFAAFFAAALLLAWAWGRDGWRREPRNAVHRVIWMGHVPGSRGLPLVQLARGPIFVSGALIWLLIAALLAPALAARQGVVNIGASTAARGAAGALRTMSAVSAMSAMSAMSAIPAIPPVPPMPPMPPVSPTSAVPTGRWA